MCSVDDGLCVLEKCALEKHVRERNEERRLVDCGEQSFEWHSDAVVGFNDVDLKTPVTCVSLVDIHHRRKIQLRIDDLVSLWRRLQTGENERLADRDVLMHHDGARLGADDVRDFVADSNGHVPPAFCPRTHTTAPPCVCIFLEPFMSCPRHRPEAMRNQINSFVENGKLAAPL